LNHMMKNTALVCAILLGEHFAQAFYLPGVTSTSFKQDQEVELKVNKLTSIEDPYPVEYYHLPFCEPDDGIKKANENLGELLAGDRIENSPYKIKMKTEMYCEHVCLKSLGRGDTNSLGTKKNRSNTRIVKSIRQNYHNNWIVDNLPAASKVTYSAEESEVLYWWGFPVGFVHPQDNLTYINNHLNIELKYHEVDNDPGNYRVVGFVVQPFSIKHDATIGEDGVVQINNPIRSCQKGVTPMHTDFQMFNTAKFQPAGGNVLFTYDVLWEEDKKVHWASRWDIYLRMDDAYPIKIHWFSIANSMAIVFVLSAMIAAILVRNLKRDVARYTSLPTTEDRAEDLEEYGWKLVHSDVFRPPNYPMLISICCGSGVQILCMSIFTIVFAWMGFLNPSRRGSLLISLIVVYALMGTVAGYCMAHMYKTFKGKSWQKATILTAFGLPGVAFAVFFILNLFTIAQKSGDAVPFKSMISLMAIWFGMSAPLVFSGAFIGFKRDPMEFPVNTSNIPRQIPDQPWFMGTIATLLFGGIMPFGSCFLELYFIMSSVWQHQYYYVFGILFVVFLILILTCAEIAILYNYFQLCGEDYQWWWRSYNTAGSTALYVFGYSFVYFKQLEANSIASYALYFGYMALVSVMLFLMTGSVGLYSSLYFNKVIFASIKID